MFGGCGVLAVGEDAVLDAAREARQGAYAPYSGLRVGAALVDRRGHIHTGANVENASFGLTMCAERVALGAAVAHGARRFDRLVIVTDRDPPVAPCGACRQALAEFGLDLRIEAVGPQQRRGWRLAELLPDPFGPRDLPDAMDAK